MGIFPKWVRFIKVAVLWRQFAHVPEESFVAKLAMRLTRGVRFRQYGQEQCTLQQPLDLSGSLSSHRPMYRLLYEQATVFRASSSDSLSLPKTSSITLDVEAVDIAAEGFDDTGTPWSAELRLRRSLRNGARAAAVRPKASGAISTCWRWDAPKVI